MNAIRNQGNFKIMKTSYLFKHLTGAILFFTFIFISAGRLDYLPGLIYVGIGVIMLVLNYTVLQIDPDLQKERSKPGADTRKWDKAILGMSFLSTLAMYIVAGLDSGRYHWSAEFHWSLTVAGIILTASGQLLFLIAQKQNRFFSSTVRIQADRGHEVCQTGLYKMVRHPAYLGSVIQTIGFPLLFGSLWSLIPIGVLLFLLVLRTVLEDRTLLNELNGYREYSAITRDKLIPFVW